MPKTTATLLRTLGVAFLLALPIAAGELFLRTRFGETPYSPGARMQAVQDHLALHPDVGFLWKPDIAASDGVLLPWYDQVVEPLSTDAWGFRNATRAIAWRREGRPVDVVGLGDSFMHDAAYAFHELFGQRGLFYYNLAMHRHSPPQYNRIFADWVARLRPRAVVYGVFENDFREARDFEAWRASGQDWFSYHSGTWAGPPVATGAATRFARRFFPGGYGFYRSVTRHGRARREAHWLEDEGVDALTAYAIEAVAIARDQGAALLLVMIPSRATVLEAPTPEAVAMAEVRADLASRGLAVLDLTPVFQSAPDPASLYYRIDAHWNARGIRVAGDAILAALSGSLEAESDQEPPVAGNLGAAWSNGPRGSASRAARLARSVSPSRP
jgi:hypothetical protein